MKKLIFIFLFAFAMFSTPAKADTTVNLTATAPAFYESGATIGFNDPLSYFVYCGTVSGVYTIAFNMTQDFVDTDGERIDVGLCVTSPGTYYFVSTAYSFLYQTESVYSNIVNRTFTTDDFKQIPMAPQITSVSP